jgi:hypothetical protein
MRAKALWAGLAITWMLAGLAIAVLVAAPDREATITKVGEVAAVESDVHRVGSPLDAPNQPSAADKPACVVDDKAVPKPAADSVPEDASTEVETAPCGPSRRASVVIDPDSNAQPSSYEDVTVTAGGTLSLPNGEVNVSGDWTNHGTVYAGASTLVFDGADQTLDGTLEAKKVVLRGGTKRIRGSFGTSGSENAEPGKASLYVEAGTTLIIEEGGKWNTPNPYGFQVAGNIVIDGGEFHCRFSNGNGTDRGEESWLPGSTLTINSGKFVGDGDADFSGASITINDGALEINDDIWSTGDTLTMLGGSMRNTTGGGMFYVTGTVSVRSGNLQVYQNSGRSLRIAKDASVYCTGGEISINGSPASGEDGGIYLGNSATLPDLVINADTKIHKDSIEGAYLSVAGTMSIAKGHSFNAAGRQVISNFTPSEETGAFIP